MKFFKLFTPFKIKDLEISNRIIMTAMHLNLADQGFISDKLIDFYVERAKGGAGMLIVGGCYVDLYGMGVPMMIAIDDDKYIPKLKEFTEAIHNAREDVKVAAQLYHSGRYSFPQLIGKKPISSSEVYSRFSKTTPRKMTKEDIENEQNAFAEAALRAKKSGFDAVEICGSAGYLMDQFMSPLVNKRTDEYGGSFKNRLRFPMETIELIRSKVGQDFIVGWRLSGDDFMGPDSNNYEDKARIAKELEKKGLDYFNITGGWHETRIPQLTMDVPEGGYTYLAENIKKYVSIPVFASNRINDPEVAEEVLQTNQADAVCMGRPLIADPDLPKKTKNGEIHDIMHCIGCNQGCFDNIFNMKPISCLRNARAANEAKTELNPIKHEKKIMIIGSGPAGLEAARVAKKRGHNVHIFEKEDKIGGLLNIIWRPPGRNEFKRMLEDYQYWIEKYNIPVHFKTVVDTEKVKEFNPDVVFLATGTKPIKISIPGIDRPYVYWANKVFSKDAPVGENNVIIGGGATGIELAIYLAEYGSLSPEEFKFLTFYDALPSEVALEKLYKGNKKVTVLEKLPKAGSTLGKTTKWVLLGRAKKLGVDIFTKVNVEEIGEGFVKYTDEEGEEHTIEQVDNVYYATGVDSDDDLYDALKNIEGMKVKKIGDARKPGTILDAVERAYKEANRI
ncbi:MAG: NAD(P)-binding protein [Candidatus Lokiarchaeota archaeon]|nr:NAD(P)-binding protein [Candidatus Lokiarchaeota archaeon]